MLSIRSSMYLTGRPATRAPAAGEHRDLVQKQLAAEAAAGIDRHDVDLMARDLERGGDR